MDNKLSELSKPVMYVVRTLDGSVASVKSHSYTAPKGFTSDPLYSQEYVSALLADRDSNQQNYQNAMEELRIERAQRQAADQRISELETKMAKPIQIVNYDEFFICHVSGASDDYCKGWVDGRNAAARDVGKAGFTVEDKQ